MKKDLSMYASMGVDAGKENVKAAFQKANENEYPGAWVNIISAFFNPDWASTQHMDGDGSKIVQRLLHYFETGDKSILRGSADDALAMNTSDIAAAGFVFGRTTFTDVLNLNLSSELKQTVMSELAERFVELRELYRSYGFDMHFLGGETADLPDQVLSAVLDVAVTSYAEKKHLITGNIADGDIIYGFASDGQAAWEKSRNGGGMANGYSMLRTVLMSKAYNEKYPMLKGKNLYRGQYEVGFNERLLSLSMLSPTRQWAILIKILMENLIAANALHHLHGISVNTGGGATKIKNLGKGGITYFKNMPRPPQLFQIVQHESGETWENMFKTFNCGIGLDVVGSNVESFHEAVKKTSADTEVILHHLGACEVYPPMNGHPTNNKVVLTSRYGTFEY